MRINFQTISRLACAILLVVAATGCGEKVPLEAKKSTFDISYSGNQFIGDTIRFQSSAPYGKKLTWKFGDGTTSTETSPQHVYYHVPYVGNTIVEDTVTMIVDNDIYQPNIKLLLLKPGIQKLVANFNWSGGRFTLHGNCCPALTDHVLNDTIFMISAVDEYTIGAWGSSLPYLPDSNYYSNERVTGRYNAVWVAYTPDTLFFKQRSGTKDGWAEITYFHKY